MISLSSISRRIHASASLTETGLIGVDFSIDNINLVQLETKNDGEISVKACCSLKYSESRDELLSSPKKLRPILREAIKEYGFKGKNIITSMPSNDVRIYSINYTKAKNIEDSESILKALQDRIDEDLSNYVIDYLPVRSSEKHGDQLAMVALVKREIAISYLELLRHSGLHVETLEIRPAAIKRLVYTVYQKQNYQNVLIVNFGTDKSYLTVTSGRRLLFDHQINIGLKALIRKTANVLEMSESDTFELLKKHGFDKSTETNSDSSAYIDNDITLTLLDIAKPILSELIEEINRILIFAASENHGESITKIFLLGSIAHINGVDKYLDKQLNISVISLSDPLASFRNSSSNKDLQEKYKPDMAISTGLALRGLIEDE